MTPTGYFPSARAALAGVPLLTPGREQGTPSMANAAAVQMDMLDALEEPEL